MLRVIFKRTRKIEIIEKVCFAESVEEELRTLTEHKHFLKRKPEENKFYMVSIY